jgi:3-hexulose-6-phosphate synthase
LPVKPWWKRLPPLRIDFPGFDFMAKKMEVSPESLLELFASKKADSNLLNENITTSQVSDALKYLTGKNGVIHGLKPIKKDLKIRGRLVTVKTRSDDWGSSLKAIDGAENGSIIFICSEGDETAVWGELFSKYAQKRGMGGTVVYGAMRDLEAVQELNYPVFSRSVVPNAGEARAEGEVNIPLECGEVEVNPGDWVIGDDCGVVVVAEELLPQVIKKASQIKKNEEEILRRIEEGYSLSKILDI